MTRANRARAGLQEPTAPNALEPSHWPAFLSAALPWLPRAIEVRERAARRLRKVGVMSHLLGLWLGTRFQKAGIVVVIGGWPLPQVENRGGSIEVENCAFYSGVRLECWHGAQIKIGNGTYLNRNTEIVAAQSVTIGRDCKIARDVIIMDSDQHRISGAALVSKPVEIGDRVWIGARALILKGVSIGEDSVVGAGAIVTKSVPPRSVVVGPAAHARERVHLMDSTGAVWPIGPWPDEQADQPLARSS